MGYNDWFGTATEILKMIRDAVWSLIKLPWMMFSKIPDWGKGIILGLLVLLTTYLAYKLWKSWNRQEFRFIKS